LSDDLVGQIIQLQHHQWFI